MGYNIYHNFPIKGSLEKVFEAITVPSQLEDWWPLKCSGQREEGATYNFNFTDDYDWYGRVEKYEPNKSFHIKMTKSDQDWDPTSFGFDLNEIQGHVLVQFWHINWPHCNGHYKQSSYCWAILLKGLKDYVEKGLIIPFESRE